MRDREPTAWSLDHFETGRKHATREARCHRVSALVLALRSLMHGFSEYQIGERVHIVGNCIDLLDDCLCLARTGH